MTWATIVYYSPFLLEGSKGPFRAFKIKKPKKTLKVPLIERDHNILKLPRSSSITSIKFHHSLMTLKVMRTSEINTLRKYPYINFKGLST